MQLYKDHTKRIVRKEIFDEEARGLAEELVKAGLPSTQFRKFFGELRAIETRLRSDPSTDSFEKAKPYLYLLVAKIHYQTRQDKRGAYAKLENFFRELIEQVNDIKDFEVMIDAVQAVLAFFIAEDAKKKDDRREGKKKAGASSSSPRGGRR